MTKIGIVGHGFVGKAVAHGFKNKHQIFIYDKFQKTLPLETVVANSEFIFVSVPTPMTSCYSKIDLSIIYEAVGDVVKEIKKNNLNPIVIVKSTIVPGTTDGLIKKFKYPHILFNPEFLTEANFLDDFINADRVVIGGHKKEDIEKLDKLYRESLPLTTMFHTNPTTAEMVKYMANTFLATKVIFANEMYELCQKLEINYEDVKKMVVADKRIYDSHLDITCDRGFGGKCFPKDSVALLGLAHDLGVDLSLLETAWKKNLQIRNTKDWEHIEGAVAKAKK